MGRKRREDWTKAAADEFAAMNQDYQNEWKDLYSVTSQRDEEE